MQLEMKPLQHRGIRAVIAWALSLLLLLSPLLSQAHHHAGPPAPVTAKDGIMPCHQMQQAVSPKTACPHCKQGGMSLQCDCCDDALPLSLPSESDVSVSLVLLLMQSHSSNPQTRPDPPPATHYRPPIDT